jgi:crotonyl-CoA carboxylase/reductase
MRSIAAYEPLTDSATPGSQVKPIYPVGELPPLGFVPERMHAAVVRQSRFGLPSAAYEIEEIPVPRVGERQVLVQVMAAGLNYNGVWAARGWPVDVIAARQRHGDPNDFHIPGSDGSGIVWAVGSGVRKVKVGDHVVLSATRFDPHAEDIRMGAEPVTSTSMTAWGFETNFGSLAQYTLVDDYQCYPKPPNLGWAEASCYMLCAATAYRQLMGWPPHTVRPGDPVLIWGGSGALGSMAIQIVRHAGGIPIAVVSSPDRVDHCMRLGAKGVINRNDFDHWGRLPDLKDSVAHGKWLDGVRAFGKKFWEILGERRNPRIVFEHSGESTIPTSLYLCDSAGMVVFCGGTSGYHGDADLRLMWMRQKRLQGSHGASLGEFAAVNQLVAQGVIDPCLSRVETLHEMGMLHDMIAANQHPPGNIAVLVGGKEAATNGSPS